MVLFSIEYEVSGGMTYIGKITGIDENGLPPCG